MYGHRLLNIGIWIRILPTENLLCTLMEAGERKICLGLYVHHILNNTSEGVARDAESHHLTSVNKSVLTLLVVPSTGDSPILLDNRSCSYPIYD